MELFKLFGRIFIDDAEADKKLDNVDKKAGGVGQKLLNMGKSAIKGAGVLVSGISTAGAAILKLADKTSEATSRVSDMSQKMGMSYQSFQEWDFILSQSGASIDSMKIGMKTLADMAVQAANGTGAGAAAFEELGLSVSNADGSLKSQQQLFEETITALQRVEDTTKRTTLANDLLGRSGVELGPLLNAGAKGVDELRKKAHELGIVLSDEAVDAGESFGDSMDQLKMSFIGLMNKGLSAAMPLLMSLIQLILTNMPTIQGIVTSLFNSVIPMVTELITDILPVLTSLFEQISGNILPPLLELFTQFVSAILPPLLQLFQQIITSIMPVFIQIMDVLITTVLPPLLDLFEILITQILPPIIDLFANIISTILPPLVQLISELAQTILPPLLDLFRMFAETILPPLMELINVLVDTILPPLLAMFGELSKEVLPILMDVFEQLLPVIEPIMMAIAAIIKTVVALIKGDWEGAWNGIKDFFINIWEGIKAALKGAINLIISGLNLFIRGMNKIKIDIPDWVPGIGDKTFGINIKEIPMLAEGGKIKKSGMAIVGDEGPELLEMDAGAKVTPLDKINPEAQSDDDDEEDKQEIILYNNNYTILDGKIVAKSTSRVQSQRNKGKQRALGVPVT